MSAAIAIAMVPQPQLRGDGQQTISYTTAGIEKQPKEADVEMDVPKITVFKSPPWQKPVPNLQIPKLSDVYEEFPAKSKMLARRLNMTRSLECIPEHTILQDTHKYSTNHLRDNNRLSPHQVLPPINGMDDDLPEMRQRAYSDPHKYSARRKITEERKDSPLTRPLAGSPTKSAAVTLPVPPKDKPSEGHQNQTVLTPDNKVLHRRTNARDGNGAKTPTSPSKLTGLQGQTRQNLSSPLSTKPPRANAVPPLRSKKLADATNSNPSTPDNLTSRVNRNRKLINKNLKSDNVMTHPSVAALKDPSHSSARNRTNSLPSTMIQPNKTRRRSTNSQPIDLQIKGKEEGMKSSVAYALIGSPGRNRWPSPERQATSYINSEDDSSIDTPPECASDDNDNHHENVPRLTPATPRLVDDNASAEFKLILKDLKSNSSKKNHYRQLTSLTDPADYFRQAAKLEKPPR